MNKRGARHLWGFMLSYLWRVASNLMIIMVTHTKDHKIIFKSLYLLLTIEESTLTAASISSLEISPKFYLSFNVPRTTLIPQSLSITARHQPYSSRDLVRMAAGSGIEPCLCDLIQPYQLYLLEDCTITWPLDSA